MNQEMWSKVDEYVEDKLVPFDPIMHEGLRRSHSEGLPDIQVSATQGKLLHLLALIRGATNILEIGTLGGYSTTWLARALPEGGRMISLEYSPVHARVARQNLHEAGVSDVVDIRVGAALDILPLLEAEGRAPFDLIFIDADKENNARYFEWALRLSRVGTVIVVDNVIRHGAIVDENNQMPGVRGTREFFDAVAIEPRVSATAIQTVGSKGYDGFAMMVVTG